MILIALVTYFTLACALAAWLLLPGLRGAVQARLTWSRSGPNRARKQAALGDPRGPLGLGKKPLETNRRISRFGLDAVLAISRHQGALWFVGLAMLLAPPLMVLSLRDRPVLEDFDDSVAVGADSVIGALLQGEQLVSPPPLPPELFTTAEVASLRPQLLSADRRWDALDPDFRQRLLRVYLAMREEHGYEMVLIEGYRSPQRQDLLAAQGSHVTQARAWQSYHQFGLAADSAFLRDGKLVISEKDPWALKGYELFGASAQRFGLTWGGGWKMADMGHVELRKPSLTRSVGGR